MSEINADKNVTWFDEFNLSKHDKFAKNPVAYFCAEFALISDLPSYAGGLGILAGDYILESADRGFPIIGIGLYYQKGQNIQDRQNNTTASKFGLKLVKKHNLTPTLSLTKERKEDRLLISIPIGNKDVLAQVWQWQTCPPSGSRRENNNSVYFLDTNIPENDPPDKLITEQLYVEDRETRLKQELVLGIGGIRLLRELNIEPSVYHMNEGHSAFLLFELNNEEKKKAVFTNHTLVREGQEMFVAESLKRNTIKLCADLNLNIENLLRQGQAETTDILFSMTTFALNNAVMTNAVSKIHEIEAKKMWPNYPITHITNGIFIPRWDRIGQTDIVKAHQKNEEKLLRLIKKTHGENWKKEALLIGWSRRFVPYKRPLALLEDVVNLKKILEFFPGKIHIVYSAPLDENDAKRNEFLKKLYELMNGDLKGYLTFIPHYNIETAEILTAGCDIWLNTPIVGREACGTSGMKAALNGTLPASTYDGWVAEVPLRDFGWLIDDQNITENLLQKLEQKIMPMYENFIKDNKGSDWRKFMETARKTIIRDFNTTRMLRDYVEKLYLPIISKNDEIN